MKEEIIRQRYEKSDPFIKDNSIVKRNFNVNGKVDIRRKLSMTYLISNYALYSITMSLVL